jgi:hypothetical protein
MCDTEREPDNNVVFAEFDITGPIPPMFFSSSKGEEG